MVLPAVQRKLAVVLAAASVIYACKKKETACTTCPNVAGNYTETISAVAEGQVKAPGGEVPCGNFSIDAEMDNIIVEQSGSQLTIHSNLIFADNGSSPVDNPFTATLNEDLSVTTNAVNTYYFDDGAATATDSATLSLSGSFSVADGGVAGFTGTYEWMAGCVAKAPISWAPAFAPE